MRYLSHFSLTHLAFALLCLYPLLIQVRKVSTIDLYVFNITPFSLLILFYAVIALGKSKFKARPPEVVALICSFAAIILDLLLWNSEGASVFFFNQYYFIEILFFFSLVSRLPYEQFIKAIYFQSLFSLSFVALEILMAGGVDMTAIAARRIGIGQGGITGFFDEPALLAYAYSLNIVILLVGLERGFLKKKITLPVLAALSVVVILTLTRAGLINLMIVFFFVLIVSVFRQRTKVAGGAFLRRNRKYVIGAAAISVFVALAVFPYIKQRGHQTDDTTYMSTVLGEYIGIALPGLPANVVFRIDQTLTAFKIIAENPLGVGPLAAQIEQEAMLLFPQFASNGSGNIVTDVYVTFGIPIATLYFWFFIKNAVVGRRYSHVERYLVLSGLIVIVVNIIAATGKIVAITPVVEKFILESPNIYIGLPIFIGPRNIEGLMLASFVAFVLLGRIENSRSHMRSVDESKARIRY